MSDWLRRVDVILTLADRQVLFLLQCESPSSLRPIFGLEEKHGPIIALTNPALLDEVPVGSNVVMHVEVGFGAWLNIRRPIITDRQLKLMIVATHEQVALLSRAAPDYWDWISHNIEVPSTIPEFVTRGIERAGARMAWRGDLAVLDGIRDGSATELSAAATYDAMVEAAESDEPLRIAGIENKWQVQRIDWAMAEARRTAPTILVNPAVATSSWPSVTDAQTRWPEATERLAAAGIEGPGRAALLLELEADAIKRFEDHGAVEPAIWASEAPAEAQAKASPNNVSDAIAWRAGVAEPEPNDPIVTLLDAEDRDWDALSDAAVRVGNDRVGLRWSLLAVAQRRAEGSEAGPSPSNATSDPRILMVDSLARLGTCAQRCRERDHAELAFEEALDLARALVADFPGAHTAQRRLTIVLKQFAGFMQQQNKFGAASSAFEEALIWARKAAEEDEKDLIEVATVLSRQGRLSRVTGQRDAAHAALNEARKLGQRLLNAGQHVVTAYRVVTASLSDLGELAMVGADFAGAERMFKEALAIHQKFNPLEDADAYGQQDQLTLLNCIGKAVLRQGDMTGAQAVFDEALGIARALAAANPSTTRSSRELAVTLVYRGESSERRGDYTNALTAYEEALTIQRAILAQATLNKQARRDVSVTLSKIGDLATEMGDAQRARTIFDETLRIRRQQVEETPLNEFSARDLSVVLNQIGDLDLRVGDRDSAEAAFREAVSVSQGAYERAPNSIQGSIDLVISLGNLGRVLQREGERAPIDEAWTQIYALRQQVPENPEVARVYAWMAQLMEAWELRPEA